MVTFEGCSCYPRRHQVRWIGTLPFFSLFIQCVFHKTSLRGVVLFAMALSFSCSGYSNLCGGEMGKTMSRSMSTQSSRPLGPTLLRRLSDTAFNLRKRLHRRADLSGEHF